MFWAIAGGATILQRIRALYLLSPILPGNLHKLAQKIENGYIGGKLNEIYTTTI